MIGMTRAHMADPHIVRKIVEGREDEIRPCVGANYCLDRIYQGGSAYCLHNAATGRELSMPHEVPRAASARKLVVVGAGPAGLEAARVAAERGHRVIVFEATGQPGGQVRLTAQSPRRREMIGIINWRVAQCSKLGVEFKFDTLAEAADVIAEQPDVVIVATGGLPHTEVLRSGNDLRRFNLGHHLRSHQAGSPRSCCSTTPAITRRCKPPSSLPLRAPSWRS